MKANFKVQWYLAITLIIINFIVLCYYDTPLADIVKFIAATIICSLIPGLVLINVTGIYKNSFYRFPLALSLGICIDIILFIIFSAFNFKVGLFFVFAGLVLWYLISRQIVNDYRLIKKLNNITLSSYIFIYGYSLFIIVLISLIYFKPNILPGVQDVIYSVDYPWHVGNIAQIKNNWFPEDPRLVGYTFHYHIFFYIYIALISYISGISIPVLFFRLYIVLFFYLLVLGAYYLGRHWYRNETIGKIMAFVTIFVGTALCSHPANLFLKDLFFSPTFFLAALLFIFTINEIKKYLEGKGSLLIIIFLLFGIIGAKGSFFPVIYVSLLLTLIFNYWKKKNIEKLTMLLMWGLVIFIPTYLYIFKTPGGEGLNLVPFEIMLNTAFYSWYINLFTEKSIWLILIFIPLYMLGFFSFRMLAFVDSLKKTILNPKHVEASDFFLLATVLISLVPSFLLNYRGLSQYFFLFVGYIVLNLLAANYIYNVLQSTKKIRKILLTILLIIGLADTLIMVSDTTETNNRLARITRKPLSSEIYAGLSYIKHNTPLDAVIGSYKAFLITEDNPRFFYYSAFAERRVVIEGWMYTPYRYREEVEKRYKDMKTFFYTRDKQEALKILSKYNIDIIIVDKRASQKLRFDTKGILEPIFSNEEIEIFKSL